MACSAGDSEYRYTEHVGMMPRGFGGLKSGKSQTITFPAPENLKANGERVELKASSDSGLPVEYYVAVGPAEIVDGKFVRATELPARAKLPLTVKIMAIQFGRGMDPQVQTAVPVERIIKVD